MSDTKSLRSDGQLAGMLQASPSEIKRAAENLQIKPDVRLNGVPYYCEEHIPALAQQIATARGAK